MAKPASKGRIIRIMGNIRIAIKAKDPITKLNFFSLYSLTPKPIRSRPIGASKK